MRALHQTARLAVAALTLAAIGAQLADQIRHGRSVINFFHFFTIESNVAAACALIVAASSGRAGMFRGAVTLYIAATGVVYIWLLSGLEEALQTTLPWVNAVLHYLTPAAVVTDWIIDPAILPRHYARTVAWWMVYPALYCLYSLVRGAITGWYPYPFLDPRIHGAASVAITTGVILIFGIAFALAIVWYARWRRAHGDASNDNG